MRSPVDMLRTAARSVYRGWMLFAHALGYVNTKLLLTVFYVLVIGPIWLITTLARHDPLQRRWKKGQSYWRAKEPVDHSVEAARHQF